MCTQIYVYVYACIYTLRPKCGSQQHHPTTTSPGISSALWASSLAALVGRGDTTCHDRLEAPLALGGILPSGALVAKDLVVLGHKGLVGQGVKALGTAEAGVMPVAVLIVNLLETKQKETSCCERCWGCRAPPIKPNISGADYRDDTVPYTWSP